MSRVLGHGRYIHGTYPEAAGNGGGGATLGFAFDQNQDGYSLTVGDPPIQIASATITVAAGSRIKVEAMTAVTGSDADGFVNMSTDSLPVSGVFQGFGAVISNSNQVVNLLGVTDPQVGGDVTVNLLMAIDGQTGAHVSGTVTALTLTEVPA